MVLAELERRGHPYRPPINEDGKLVIRDCDLTNETVGNFRKVRPGIEKLLNEGIYQSVKIEAITPVRIEHPIAGKLQFESSVPVSLPAISAGLISSQSLSVSAKVEAETVRTQKLECQDLEARIVEVVTLRVERDAAVEQLDVSEDISIGSKLDWVRSVRVRGKANIGSLGDNIPPDCKVDGNTILEVFREKGVQAPRNERLDRRPGVTRSADHRIGEAFNTLLTQNKMVSTSRLAKLSGTNYHTAERWLKEHYSERVVRDQDEPAETNSSKTSAPVTVLEKLAQVVSPMDGSSEELEEVEQVRTYSGVRM
jgi:hypothetical protein